MAQSHAQREAAGSLTTHRFKQDTYRRRYKLYTPANARQLSGPRPLVLVIHGGGSTDRGMIKLDQGRWNELADQHGFYVAYPNAVDKLWDFGEGLTSEDLDHRVDDLAYFERVLDEVSKRRNIDHRRIFATGISRGGQSSYFLACNLPGRIRAIMPVAMSLPDFMQNECTAGPAVGVAVLNGTADPQVPYGGGWITVFGKKRDVVLSTEKTLALWRARNGCADQPIQSESIDKPGDKTSVDISRWTHCEHAPVELYKVNNGGHTWPSGVQYLPPRIVGETSNDISAADEGWAFFSQF
ncbi:MAG: PHB depolymerase family esterase [Lysobacterales bacterium]